MVAVCLYFQVHHPAFARRDYTFFNIGQDHNYEDEERTRLSLVETVRNCYLPANNLMLEMISDLKGEFRVAYSISGTTVEQLQRYAPEALDSFKRLAETGCVEFINETYYHSLSFLFSKNEFHGQILKHYNMIGSLFGQKPKTFRNTELIYNNDLAKVIEDMGYTAILTEGADHVFGWRTPNFVYRPVTCRDLKVLARNYRLSEEISSRALKMNCEPLNVDKFIPSAHAIAGRGELLNLFMDYRVFDKSREKETRVFDFFSALPRALLKHPEFCFRTPEQVASAFKPVARLDVPHCISWSDIGRDTSTWLGGSLQDAAVEYLFKLEKSVLRTGDQDLIEQWRRLQSSDHFCAMCTKTASRNGSGQQSKAYDSPYLAHIAYMNILNDLHERIKKDQNSKK
jgi:alpha-amylase